MNKRGRTQLALGILLILLGAWFLFDKVNPQFHSLFARYTTWPLNMILIGAGILVLGLVIGSPGLAVPAAIVAGIGGIVYYQKVTENDAWYTWILLLGCIGMGNILAGLLGENTAHNLKQGLKLIVISAAFFLAFVAYFGKVTILGVYAPAILLILLGLWVLGSGIYSSFRKRDD